MSLVVGLHCGDKRDFIFGAPTDLAAGQFATKIGIINFDTFREYGGLLAFKHDLHELMLDSPSGSITDPDEASEFQDRNIVFVLSLEEYRLKSCSQRQF